MTDEEIAYAATMMGLGYPKPVDTRSVDEKYDLGGPSPAQIREAEARNARKAAIEAKRRRRIRKAITQALDWREIAAFAGAGRPEQIDAKRARAKQARDTLERIIFEEIARAERNADR